MYLWIKSLLAVNRTASGQLLIVYKRFVIMVYQHNYHNSGHYPIKDRMTNNVKNCDSYVYRRCWNGPLLQHMQNCVLLHYKVLVPWKMSGRLHIVIPATSEEFHKLNHALCTSLGLQSFSSDGTTIRSWKEWDQAIVEVMKVVCVNTEHYNTRS
jgi:hypothetical protein